MYYDNTLYVQSKSSVLRRRGPKTTIHPGRKCGPCQLCCKSAYYYIHLSTWDPELSTKLWSMEKTITVTTEIIIVTAKRTYL